MAGGRIPGPQRDPDPSVDDGTLTRAKSPTPGVTTADAPSKPADTTAAPQATPTLSVFFFGGFRSEQSDVDAWVISAHNQRKDVKFQAFPYPEHTASVPPDNILSKFGSAISAIKDSKASKIFIVGHSSGCAIANGVANRFKDNPNIALIALDGFLPDVTQLTWPNTRVWGAVGGKKGKSLHHDGMQSGGKSAYREFTAHDDCTNLVSLHFSLVNTEASDKFIKDFDDIKKGYKDCVANLCWL